MRKIIHCDADCFYASVELRDNPRLQGKPIAVGGKSSRRGVISTCNYIARRYGVHSAMPSSQAMKLCPDLLILPGRMDVYREVSKSMRDIFSQYSDLVEPLSLDEAYLDVSDSDLCQGSATLMAREIQQAISKQLGITVSAGIAENKFLAKVASDWNKPEGIFVVPPDKSESFIEQLPVGKIPGVGKVTESKMHLHGLKTCAHVKEAGAPYLTKNFGRFGQRLYDVANGIDERRVQPDHIRKSLSVERTFSTDLSSSGQCEAALPKLLEELTRRLSKIDTRYRVVKTFVKVKFFDFKVTSLERTNTRMTLNHFKELLFHAMIRRNGTPIRLLGMGVRFEHLDQELKQLELFDALE